jgi:hypothetical protein
MQNYKILLQSLLGELAISWREERERERERGERREEKKMPFIVATYVYASSQGQHTHSVTADKRFILASNKMVKNNLPNFFLYDFLATIYMQICKDVYSVELSDSVASISSIWEESVEIFKY